MNETQSQGLTQLLDELYEAACRDYRRTEEYELLREKEEELERQRAMRTAPGDRELMEEYLGALLSGAGHEGQYLYRRGMWDCVSLLKLLRVLA